MKVLKLSAEAHRMLPEWTFTINMRAPTGGRKGADAGARHDAAASGLPLAGILPYARFLATGVGSFAFP